MANLLTNAYRNRVVQGTEVDLSALATLSGLFIDNADDTVAATDADLSTILSAARVPAVGSAPALASKTFGTVATGVFDAADLVFTSLTGDPSEQFMIFKNTGVDATSVIYAAYDVTVTPNGGNITVVFNASGIWQF